MTFRLARALPALLGACVLALYAAHLGSYGLLEQDEARFADVAREMVESGDWLVPHLNGIAHFTKPPLAYWSAAVGFSLLGPTETAARLGPLAAALVTLAAVWAIARRLAGEATAGFAVAVLATGPEFFFMGRTLSADIFLTAGCAVALLGAARELSPADPEPAAAARRRPLSQALFWGGLGVGVLAKGPVALLIVGGALAGPALAASGRHRLAGLGCWWGPLLFAAVGLSWYAAVAARTPGLLAYWLGREVVGRVATDLHHRTRPWYFFLPVLAVGLLPWSVFLPAAGHAWLRGGPAGEPRGQGDGDGRRLVLAWLVVPLALLSLSRSKLATYVLPLLPAAALITGGYLARLPALAATRGARLTACVLTVLGFGIAAGLALAARHTPADLGRFFVPDAPPAEELGEMLGPLAAGALLGGLLLLVGRPRVAHAACLAGAAGALLQMGAELPDVAAAQSLRALSAEVGRAPADRVVAFHVNRYGLRFYVGRPVLEVGGGRDLRFERDPGTAARRLAPVADDALAAAYGDAQASGGRLYVVTHSSDAERARALVPAPLEPLGTAGDLLLLAAAPGGGVR